MATWPVRKQYAGTLENPQRVPQPAFGTGNPITPTWTVGVPYGAYDQVILPVTVHKATTGLFFSAEIFVGGQSGIISYYNQPDKIAGNLYAPGNCLLIWSPANSVMGWLRQFKPGYEGGGAVSWSLSVLIYTGNPSPTGGPGWYMDRAAVGSIPPVSVPCTTCVPIPESVHVYLNSIEQREVVDWNLLPSDAQNEHYRVQVTEAMGEQPGDLLEVRYACRGSGTVEGVL